MKPGATCLVAALMLLFSGCTSNVQRESDSDRTAQGRSSSATAEVGPDWTSATPWDQADAFTVIGNTDALADGQVTLSGAIAGEHEFAASQYFEPMNQDVMPASSAVLVDAHTGKTQRLSDGSTRQEPMGFNGMGADDDWVVWTETTSMDLYVDPWVMYAFDRHSGRTTEIASAPDVAEGPPPMAEGGTIPTVENGVVYFAAVSRATGNGPVTSIYKVPADGSEPMERIIERGYWPDVDHGVLTYHRGREVRRFDISSGADTATGVACGADEGECQISVGEGVIVKAASHPDLGNRTLVRVRTPERSFDLPIMPATVHYVTATSRWVGLTATLEDGVTTIVFIYDLEKRALYQLPENSAFNTPRGRGDELLWARVGNDDDRISRNILMRLTD